MPRTRKKVGSMITGLKVIDIFDRITENNDGMFGQASWKDFLTKAQKEIEEVKNAPESKRLLEYADVAHLRARGSCKGRMHAATATDSCGAQARRE